MTDTAPENALILYRGDLPQISISETAIALKDSALELAALVARVTNETEQNIAVNAQIELKRVSKAFEEARLEKTTPLLKAQRDIKAMVDKLRAELDEEYKRIEGINSQFIEVQKAKLLAAEALKNAELNRIERERQEALAKADTHDERDAINSVCDIKTAEAQVPIFVPARATGQHVTEDWDIEVKDIHALYRAHPQCVKLEPRMAEIKMLLNNGIKVSGVVAVKKVKAGVRLS